MEASLRTTLGPESDCDGREVSLRGHRRKPLSVSVPGWVCLHAVLASLQRGYPKQGSGIGRPCTSWASAGAGRTRSVRSADAWLSEQALNWGRGQSLVTSSLLCVLRQAFVHAEPRFPHVER